jgi:hypothetical protein
MLVPQTCKLNSTPVAQIKLFVVVGSTNQHSSWLRARGLVAHIDSTTGFLFFTYNQDLPIWVLTFQNLEKSGFWKEKNQPETSRLV